MPSCEGCSEALSTLWISTSLAHVSSGGWMDALGLLSIASLTDCALNGGRLARLSSATEPVT